MKKLVVMLSVAAAAVFAHANTISWSIGANQFKDANGANIGSGVTVYLIEAAQAAAIESAVADGTFTASTAGVLDSTTTANKGAVNAKKTADTLNTGSYSVAVMYIDSGKVFISGAANATTYNPATEDPNTITFMGTHASNPITDGGWKTPSSSGGGGGGGGVPEPTSALMLVMGGALLGLRRKRA